MTIPPWSEDAYTVITEFAAGSGWLTHLLFEVGTDLSIIVLALLAGLAWWRARSDTATAMAAVLLIPVGSVIAYVLSEGVKLLVREERPCRNIADTVAACPEIGDWSFPSNHTVIAMSIAIGLMTTWRRNAILSVFAVAVAVFAGFSRVFVGAHYPHDVLAGIAFGTILPLAVVVPLLPLGTRVVDWFRAKPIGVLALGAPHVTESDTVMLPVVTKGSRR